MFDDTNKVRNQSGSEESLNRRKVLKQLSVGTAALSFSGTATASEESKEKIQKAKDDAETISLFDEIGNPKILNEEFDRTVKTDVGVTNVDLITEYGTLYHTTFEEIKNGTVDSEETAVYFELDLSSNSPEGIYENVPTGTSPTLVYQNQGVVFVRSVTKDERKFLDSVIEIEEYTPIYDGSKNKYYIDSEIESETNLWVSTNEKKAWEGVPPENKSQVKIEPEVRTQIPTRCASPCFDCTGEGASCAVCAPRCTSMIKLPICAACVWRRCRDAPGDCARCVSCITPYM